MHLIERPSPKSFNLVVAEIFKLHREFDMSFWITTCLVQSNPKKFEQSLRMLCLLLCCCEAKGSCAKPRKRAKPKKCSTWRAFLRLHSNPLGAPNNKTQAMAYGDCKAEAGDAWQKIVRLSKAATMSGGQLPRRFASKRQLVQRIKQGQNEDLCQKLQTCCSRTEGGRETRRIVDVWLADYEKHIGLLSQVKSLQQETPALKCFDLVAVPAASTMQCYELGWKSIERGVFFTPGQKKELATRSIVVVISSNPGAVAPSLQPTEVEKSSQHIFGIPLMYFTPYRATLELLLPVPDDSNVPQVAGQVCVKVACANTP
eukprot:3925697-Amphidinium_carterae.3